MSVINVRLSRVHFDKGSKVIASSDFKLLLRQLMLVDSAQLIQSGQCDEYIDAE